MPSDTVSKCRKLRNVIPGLMVLGFGGTSEASLRHIPRLLPDDSRFGPPGSNGRKTQEPLESSAIVGAVAIVARLIFSVPLYLLT